MTWTPISLDEILKLIHDTETDLEGDLLNFWKLIKIHPEKWTEMSYGQEGNGFWVVGLIGRTIVWYNDIEEGFNISDYKTYGEFDEYFCNQDKLAWTLVKLFDSVKLGTKQFRRLGPPTNLE